MITVSVIQNNQWYSASVIMFNCFPIHLFVSIYGEPMYTSGLAAVAAAPANSLGMGGGMWLWQGVGAWEFMDAQALRGQLMGILAALFSQHALNQSSFL